MFTFAPPQQPVVPVWGNEDALFPVNRIYCVARNYGAHDLEMGGTGKEKPFFFQKPADAVFPISEKETAEIPFPMMTDNLNHEIELVAAIGRGGKNIPVEEALSHVWGWAVGVDLTRRDLQAEAKAKGRPWTAAKSFDQSAPISSIRPVDKTVDTSAIGIWLYVNNQPVQKGNTNDMISNTAEVIAEISKYWELKAGDLIFTGTPGGVGKISKGDLVRGGCDGVGMIEFRLV